MLKSQINNHAVFIERPSFVKLRVLLMYVLTWCLTLEGGVFGAENVKGTSAQTQGVESNVISLAGAWQIRMDKPNDGVGKKWFLQTFSGDAAELPGTVYSNHRQPPVTSGGMKGFSAVYPYSGGVWYQRQLEIPQGWYDKQVTLFLERCQWETLVWLDDEYIGTCNSLVAPHIYELPDKLMPGKHRLTILVNNSNRKGEAEVLPQDLPRDKTKHYDLSLDVKSEAKLNCGGHHTLFGGTDHWNGILGRLELRAVESQHLISLDVYPELSQGAVKIKTCLGNRSKDKTSVRLRVKCRSLTAPVANRKVTGDFLWKLSGAEEQTFHETLSLKKPVDLWDEFSPDLYLISAELLDNDGAVLDRKEVRFGMRELGREGLKFTINGRPTFMRGVLEDFIFPITGYPPMDVASWRRVIAVANRMV